MPHETAAATVQVGDGKTIETSIGGKIKVPVKLTRRHKFVDPLKLVAMNLPGQLKPGDLTIAKDKTDGTIEVFVKDKNTAVGEYTFFLKGDAKFKYSRNPEAVAREEAEYKRLEAELKKTNEEKTKLTGVVAEAKKALPKMDKAIAAAKTKMESEQKKIKDATAKVQTLEKSIATLKSNEKPDAAKIKMLEEELARAKTLASDTAKLQQAEAELKTAEKSKAELSSKLDKDQKNLTALDAKAKQLDAATKAAKGRFDNLKKQSNPKDLFYMAVSNPLRLKVVQSPIVIKPIPQQSGQVEAAVSPSISIERKYGFADVVNLTFKLPKGVELKPVAIPKDKTEMPLPIKIQKTCPPGEHTIEVTASAKFNNVDVKSTTSFKLQVASNSGSTEVKK